MLNHLRKTYTPAQMPYHFIVPSLIGYGWSSPPPIDRAFAARDCAGVFETMMVGLGFGKSGGKGGYFAQGGDIGSFVTRQLSTFDSCIGIHLNFFPMLKASVDLAALDATDKKCIERAQVWESWGLGYLVEHATMPATIGAILESSPVAVLAWYVDIAVGADTAGLARSSSTPTFRTTSTGSSPRSACTGSPTPRRPASGTTVR